MDSYRLMRHAREQRSMVIGAMLAEIASFVISRVGSVFRPYTNGHARPQPDIVPSRASRG
jgi:hypothetical protein